MLVVMHVETFKTAVTVFICNVIMFDGTLTDNFQLQSQLIDAGNITRRDQRQNVQITNTHKYSRHKHALMLYLYIAKNALFLSVNLGLRIKLDSLSFSFKYCYSDSRNLCTVMRAGGLAP